MSNYFDNQGNWSWYISDKSALVTTDHGDHTHTLDVTNVPIGEMVDHTGEVMGEARRSASHDFKEDVDVESTLNNSSLVSETENNAADNTVQSNAVEDESVDNGSIDGGEDCDDGLDI